MPEYLFDVKTVTSVRVTADNLNDARQSFESLDGITLGGHPFQTSIAHATMHPVQVSLDTDEHDDLDALNPVEKDGEDVSDMVEPYECDECGDLYDEAGGDGYNGRCPSCADKMTED